MSILSGYKKFKRYVLTDEGYQLCSQWTSSNTVHFDDEKDAETKVGAIDGITDSLSATSSNVALSAAAGNKLQEQINSLNTGMGGEMLLWENPVTTSAFPSQKISLDLRDYHRFTIVFMKAAPSQLMTEYMASKGSNFFSLVQSAYPAVNGAVFYERTVVIDDDGIEFSDTTYTNPTSQTTVNTGFIPAKIYGWRKC